MLEAIAATPVHSENVLKGLLRIPGYIDDVACRMIELARQAKDGATIECRYGGVYLHARKESTVAQIRLVYESAILRQRRQWPRIVRSVTS